MTNQVFLDLENPSISHTVPEQAGNDFLLQFTGFKDEIGKRYIEIQKPKILHNVTSIRLFQQAKALYCLGLYESTIMVSRSTVEYIVSEIWRSSVEAIKDEELANFIVDSIDFRKMLENLSNRNVITAEAASQSHQLYTLGNKYIHPKSGASEPKEDALTAITILGNVVSSLRNILNEYDIKDGVLTAKE